MTNVLGQIIFSERSGPTAIGKANEDFEGIRENNSHHPDKDGIEYKIHDAASSSAITLFTSSPSYPRKINSLLRHKYGRMDEAHNIKTMHISLFANSTTTFNNFRFMSFLRHDRIHVIAEDLEFHWSFADLYQKTMTKLNFFNYREAEKISKSFFKINKEEVFQGFNFDNFINLFEDQEIFIDIRLGIDRKKGKPHDHGTAFRIAPSKITHLYDGRASYTKPRTLEDFLQ